MGWIGIPDSEIQQLALEAIKHKDEQVVVDKTLNFDLPTVALPKDCKTIDQWLQEGCVEEDFLAVVEYVLDRGLELEWYDWMWCEEKGYRDRVIIPFYHQGRIVGWTGRKIVDGTPKYLTHSSPGYIFNLDHQDYDRKYVIVVEGQIDAISVDGVAIMHNEPNDTQIARIKSLAREVIVVPDNDQAGTKLIKTAVEQHWSVSLPDWGPDVKDVADAVKKYGRVYTLYTIIKYRVTGEIKLTMLKKRILNGNE